MLLVCRPTVCERSETIKTGLNNNHPASRGVYLSVMTCPFSHTAGRKITGLALVVMETLNIFFFFLVALDAPCLVHNKASSEEAGDQYKQQPADKALLRWVAVAVV